MQKTRIFEVTKFIQRSEGEPIRAIVTESPESVVTMWYVMPGQQVRPHIHPSGQDTWVVLSGEGQYVLDADGTTMPIASGHVVVAHTGQVHGVLNSGSEPLQFVSIVAPADAGFELVKA
ncbi:cupin domain-containing protein [Acidithiobacillus sp.]